MRAIIVFGASLTSDGAASPALARRSDYAVEAARAHPDAPIFCSGAARNALVSEASVIARLLVEAGVGAERLVLDPESRDTLQTAVAAAAFLRRRRLTRAVVCTEAYHMPRARMLLSALGAQNEPACARGRPADAPRRYWRRMQLREAAAYLYDLAVVRWRRRDLMAMIAAA